jgi:hypothetical protein
MTLLWMPGMSTNLRYFREYFFLILERAKNLKGQSQVNKVAAPFFVTDFLGRN